MRAISSTFVLVLSDIRPVPRMTWLAVAMETPAFFATVSSFGFSAIGLTWKYNCGRF
ncbi:hypothetical protein [Ruegeria sp. HKCCA6707]|uniref:hypothetical protein n=1 Tax=Ruegeria sp. HKCCA6707 TaxID=2682996 RepID=UPI00352F7840